MVVEISDWNDLDNVRNDLTGDYVLVNDLDENTDGYTGIGDDFEPIGFIENDDFTSEFAGSFDGDGFSISNLVIEYDNVDGDIALFASTDTGSLIENLSVDGSVTVTNSGRFNYAGLVGIHRDGTIQNCVSHVDVTALDGTNVGGLVGSNEDTVTDSYATGSVEGDSRVGGFIGSQSSDTVTDCYSTGFVSGNTEVNGFLGREDPFEPNYTNTYYDTETSGQDDTNEATPLTTAEMQGSEAETNMDFDFANVWDSVLESDDDTSADGYPILIALDRENQLDAQGILLLFDLTVETNPATNISEFSATLNGELVELDDEAEDADVFFEFGENVTDSQTAIQTLTKPETFDELIDELEPNTTFEFRAVAEAQDADNETFIDEGDVLTFDTEIVTLDGTISLDEAGVENADVVANNLTQATFGGQTTTDIDGNYAVDLPDADRLDTVAVAVDFDDGTERYGRLVTTVLE